MNEHIIQKTESNKLTDILTKNDIVESENINYNMGVEVYAHLGQAHYLNDFMGDKISTKSSFDSGDYVRVLKNLKDNRKILRREKLGCSNFQNFIYDKQDFGKSHCNRDDNKINYNYSNAIVKIEKLEKKLGNYLTNNNSQEEAYILGVNFRTKNDFLDRTKERTVDDLIISFVGNKKDIKKSLNELLDNYEIFIKNIIPENEAPNFYKHFFPTIQCEGFSYISKRHNYINYFSELNKENLDEFISNNMRENYSPSEKINLSQIKKNTHEINLFNSTKKINYKSKNIDLNSSKNVNNQTNDEKLKNYNSQEKYNPNEIVKKEAERRKKMIEYAKKLRQKN